MQPTAAVIRAVARAMRRDAGSFFALKVNNFFLFILLLIGGNVAVGLPPRSAYPFLLLLGFLLLFPLSSDPLAKIPPLRLASWPLTRSHRAMLRLTSLAMSPIFWVALILLFRAAASLALALLALTVAVQGALALLRHSPDLRGAQIALPPALPSKLGPLITAAVRQLLSILDTYVALLIAIGGCVYRLAYAMPDRAAYPILSLLIALALSTYAQCLFTLDSPSSATRYLLLPLSSREIILAKDAAYVSVILLLTLALSPIAGISFALVSLAIGRIPLRVFHSTQSRWRFMGGRFTFGVLQVTLGGALGLAAAERSPLFGLIAFAGYIVTALTIRKKLIPTLG